VCAGGGWNRPGPTAGRRTGAGTAAAARWRRTPARPKNTYVREDKILPHLPALHLLLTTPAVRARRRTRSGTDVRPAATTQDVIGYLREHEITLTWDPAAATVRARAPETAKTVTATTR